jgi:hypothetical protein
MTEIVTEKRCGKCEKTKPISDFHHDKSRKCGVHSQCKQCVLEYHANQEERREYAKAYYAAHQEELRKKNKAYRVAHQEELRENAKTYKAAHREQYRNSHLKRRYRITAADFDTLLAAQGGRCAICGTDQAGGRDGVFNVDHDHVSGRVRGLLCRSCNVGIGHLQDNPDLLRAASRYIAGITE